MDTIRDRVIRKFLSCLFLALSLFGLAALNSCEKTNTVEVIKNVHDTVNVVHNGPALIRFVSLLPGATPNIILRDGPQQSSAIFTEANSYVTKQYIPIVDSSSLKLYASYYIASKLIIDSVTLPILAANSLTTCAIFLVTDPNDQTPHLNYRLVNDSLKLHPPQAGYSYIRMVNGLADYPTPTPMLNLFLDSVTADPFFVDAENGAAPVLFGDMNNYRLIKVNGSTRHVFFKPNAQSNAIFDSYYQFAPGSYYTVKVSGSWTNGTQQFRFDQE